MLEGRIVRGGARLALLTDWSDSMLTEDFEHFCGRLR